MDTRKQASRSKSSKGAPISKVRSLHCGGKHYYSVDEKGVLRFVRERSRLIERGFATDVMLAAQLNVSACAPLLVNDAYIRAEV